MAHNIMRRNGKDAMFCIGDRDSAWHRLGQRTNQVVTWAEAIKLADLDWTVEKRQAYCRNPLGTVVSIPSFATFRMDDDAYLGTVGEGYTVIQNRDIFTFVDTFLEAANGAHYESAGALGNGERIWCLARIPEADYQIDGGDEHKTFVMAASSHDGSFADQLKLVDERVVCQNTFNIALRENGACWKIKHTVNAKARLAEAMTIMQTVKREAVGLKGKMMRLADRKLTRESVEHILDRLFPAPKDAQSNTTRRDNNVAAVLDLYASNDNNAFASVKGTAYNLFNAVTEYVDHQRTARGNGSDPAKMQVARSESALFGSGERLKTQALTVIMEEVDIDTVDSGIGYLDK